MTNVSAQRPPLAVAIVSLIGADAVARTLRSIGDIDCPHVVIDADVPVPMKRVIGIDSTDSEWVALLEDTCDVSAGWRAACGEIAKQTEFDVAGGPVTIAADLPSRCMALACLEYAAYAVARVPAAVAASRLAGLNLLYRRSAMPQIDRRCGLIESEFNGLILRNGGKLLFHPGLAVTYREANPVSATFASMAAHGCIYGGGQRERLGASRRALAALKCAALPLVFYLRAVRAIPSAHRFPLRARLWILWLAVGWSLGELRGVVAGRGASLAAWR